MGRSGRSLAGAQRMAAIAVLAVTTLATWQLILPAVDTGQDQSAAQPSAGAPAPSSTPIRGMGGVYVAVLNVTGTTGSAGAAAASLEARGVRVSYVGDGMFTNHPTVVLYRPGAQRQAGALAQALHLPPPKRCQSALVPSIGIARIVVLVGPGGVRG